MKRTGLDHPKMKMLSRRLGIPIAYANGIMERLWHFAGKYCPRGDIGRFSDDEIAIEAGWEGDADTLISALRSKGSCFLDDSPAHRLIIHDWPDHCEDSVHKWLVDRMELFADGSIPKLTKIPLNQRVAISDAYGRIQKDLEGSRIPEKDSEGFRIPENSHRNSETAQPCLALPVPSLASAKPEPSREAPAAPVAPVDSLVSEIAKEMRAKHRKTAGLGGLELERELCGLTGDAADPAAVLRSIRARWRLGVEREWAQSPTQYWPNLLEWLRKRRYLDPDPPERDVAGFERPTKSRLEAMIDAL